MRRKQEILICQICSHAIEVIAQKADVLRNFCEQARQQILCQMQLQLEQEQQQQNTYFQLPWQREAVEKQEAR